jgi:ATP-binding cassette, subfamily F, member 3
MVRSSSVALRFDRVLFGYGAHVVLDRVSFTLAAGERAALVGTNGAGKSSLLRLIVGELEPESGAVELGVTLAGVGFLRQEFAAGGATTVREFLDAARPDLAALRREFENEGARERESEGAREQENARARERETEGESDGDTGIAFAAMLDAYDVAGGWAFEARREEVATGLGIGSIGAEQPLATLSGGEQTRLGMAQLLLREPALLLLDEPTNHLDLDALLWLEAHLASYRGSVLLVSHDQVFLDRVANRTLVLEDGALEDFRGAYSAYLQDREARRERQLDAYRQQQDEVARLHKAIGKLETGARSVEAATIDFAPRAKAKRVARQATVMKRRLERELDQHRIEKPAQDWRLKLDLEPVGDTGQIVLACRGVGVRFGDRDVLRDVDFELRRGERVALAGPNGAGKTTLLRVLIGELAPDAGVVTRGPSARVGYVAQGREALAPSKTLLDVIRDAGEMDEAQARGFAHYLLFRGDDVFKLTVQLSAGERARLAIGALVLAKVNTLVLDEPTNHLDLAAQGSLAAVLAEYRGALLIASHNRGFLARIGVERSVELRDGAA